MVDKNIGTFSTPQLVAKFLPLLINSLVTALSVSIFFSFSNSHTYMCFGIYCIRRYTLNPHMRKLNNKLEQQRSAKTGYLCEKNCHLFWHLAISPYCDHILFLHVFVIKGAKIFCYVRKLGSAP